MLSQNHQAWQLSSQIKHGLSTKDLQSPVPVPLLTTYMRGQPACCTSQTCFLTNHTLREPKCVSILCWYKFVFLSIISHIWPHKALHGVSPSYHIVQFSLLVCMCIFIWVCPCVFMFTCSELHMWSLEDNCGCIPQAPSTFVCVVGWLTDFSDWFYHLSETLWQGWGGWTSRRDPPVSFPHSWDFRHAHHLPFFISWFL